MQPSDKWKSNIIGLIDDMRQTNRDLLAQGIDARDPADREVLDIVKRIERKLKRKIKQEKSSTPS